jgi:uncharacterized membrane protein
LAEVALGVEAEAASEAGAAASGAAARPDAGDMKLTRLVRHLCSTRWTTLRRFTPQVLQSIEAAIREVEARHAGEIRFAVETALDLPELWRDLATRRRATQVFGQLGVWDTAQNNGVLIYILLADHVVEIIADRGIAARVQQLEWDQVCREIERNFREGRFESGSVTAIHAVGQLIGRHFPATQGDADELPNQPVLL